MVWSRQRRPFPWRKLLRRTCCTSCRHVVGCATTACYGAQRSPQRDFTVCARCHPPPHTRSMVVQGMFGHLLLSDRKFYNPMPWLNSYKDETGKAINVLVQQDAQVGCTCPVGLPLPPLPPPPAPTRTRAQASPRHCVNVRVCEYCALMLRLAPTPHPLPPWSLAPRCSPLVLLAIGWAVLPPRSPSQPTRSTSTCCATAWRTG
jgi:hypothetical protein